MAVSFIAWLDLSMIGALLNYHYLARVVYVPPAGVFGGGKRRTSERGFGIYLSVVRPNCRDLNMGLGELPPMAREAVSQRANLLDVFCRNSPRRRTGDDWGCRAGPRSQHQKAQKGPTHRSNENKMSYHCRGQAQLGVTVA